MPEKPILPWISVNNYMQDEYRATVVDLALRHLAHASKDLREFAKRKLSEAVAVRGFRSFDRAPVDVARPYVVKEMKQAPGVATAIICLWAESERKLIQELQVAAEAEGLRFHAGWSWQEAQAGFCPFEEMTSLAKCTEMLTEDKSSPEADHLWLAALWLSRALISAPSGAVLESSASSSREEISIDRDEISPERVSGTTEEPVDPGETLIALRQSVQECGDAVQRAHKTTIVKAQAVLKAVEASDPAKSEAQLVVLQDALAVWQDEENFLDEVVQQAQRRLFLELEVRPDLDLNVSMSALLDRKEPKHISSVVAAERVSLALNRVLEYDREKQDVLDQLDQIHTSVVGLQNDIAQWMQDESFDIEGAFPFEGDEAEVTLTEARASLEQAIAGRDKLEARRSQLRELSLNRIATMINRLQELGVPTETNIVDDFTLGALTSSRLIDLTSHKLWLIEQALVKEVDQQEMKAKATAPDTLAAELQSEWDGEKFVGLLDRLAGEKRDVEGVLLLLGASATHPRAKSLNLPRSVVRSLLRGIGQLSRRVRLFELLNLLAPDLLKGWETTDEIAQAELCLVFLAGQYSRHRLPSRFLWQLSVEWPVDGMSNWNRLWQSALMDEPLSVITVDQDDDWMSRLEQARSRAAQMMAREHGVFVRLNSLKSRRHAALLRDEIMPDFLSCFNQLQKIEADMQSAAQHELYPLLAQLEELVTGELTRALHEDTLIEIYEAGAVEVGIDDSNPFHRRTALRVLEDCARSIQDYGQALLEFGRIQVQHDTKVTREALRSELTVLPELTSLGQAALEQIAQGVEGEMSEWHEETARSLAAQQLSHELLSQAVYVSRFPRVVGYLTGARLDWTRLLERLLNDLAEPIDPDGAALLLIEQEAPNQVLLLTQYVSLDIQKQAQSLKRDKEQEVGALETGLIKAGGRVEDLFSDRELGRWRLVGQELKERLAVQEALRRDEEQQIQNQAHQLRHTINTLDMTLFEARGTIPTDVYQMVEQGLNLARKATGTDVLFEAVETYLQEIRYRLEHQSWPLAELQKAISQLEQAVAGESRDKGVTIGAEEVLNLLERGELRQLDLNPGAVTTSEVETRCELLRNWLSVRALPTLMSEDLEVAERTAIQTLVRYFARMVVLKRTRAPGGKPLAYEDPIVYSYWELQYPKTAVLDNKCILVALPGEPPSARDLKELEYFLEEKERLETFFVFLFAPGCTPAINRRLRSSYQNRGLVIIDEPAILDMVLAETEFSNPLGRLRPMMLNALGAEKVDVFKINQLVKSRTDIFVGRETLVDRIASSGDNYAVYGGRRIGKSSVLAAVEDRLKRRGIQVVFHSFEGDKNCSDNASARKLARLLKLDSAVRDVGDFKPALQAYLEATPDVSLVLLIDEVDRYILDNPDRHVLIETLRALSDRYGSRFRVVIAGFMKLHDCLHGRGPYTPASDPWGRMLNDIGPLENLRPVNAERIVREGFISVLGWKFENEAIPQRIVELTGGHPAFVQYFCLKLQQHVAQRRDRLVRLEDVEAVFANRDPEQSFIAYVRKTLEMNLKDPISRYLILWLAAESSEAQGFTLDQMRELASLSRSPIPEERLNRSLERLSVTRVVKARALEVYEFSVPDYPLILDRLGETVHLDKLEDQLERSLDGGRE